ncbi:17.3 kDa class II heat shock protein-like [Juglans microcarpa x Juglans regia]|uniref:17.3 kDa class II heat shock protein-like n=1 Tax=Juglans microcarpa x Juglans regia TaxID=2249226 RepID=UPI001B7D93BE|nr:17.3 kDa class II heat shock protein-like [Juglans microcarpa x Juglans regia]
MDLRMMGLDPTIMDTLHELLDFPEESDKSSHHAPSRAYVRDAKAMSATPADVKDYPESYVFVIDMPGLKPDQIKVQVEDNMLVVSGERRREREKDQGVKYVRMERRLGKYLKKFMLPEDSNPEKISAVYQDGVLTVTVQKKPKPEPKKPKTVEVQVA